VNEVGKFGSIVSAIAVAVALTACGNGKGDKPATQMAARVNGDEITVHQVNAVLARAAGVTQANAAQAKKEILDRLIDQQLAVQQAEEKKLDRTPNVVQAIDAARREILARAYLEQVAAAQPKPAAEAVKQYYVEHPELFAQRRIYNLQEMSLPADATLTEEIKGWVGQGKSMQDMANALKARDVRFIGNVAVRSAEQLAIELLPRFQRLKDGGTMVVEGPQSVAVVHLVSSQPSPIDEAAAQQRIEQFLASRQQSEAVAADIKALRVKAKIDRMGEFAPGAEATTAAPAVNLDKGVAGLK
jgi:EpsD family peptidyl-prolyl cis-trans isomerase